MGIENIGGQGGRQERRRLQERAGEVFRKLLRRGREGRVSGSAGREPVGQTDLIRRMHTELVSDIGNTLDIQAGLAQITGDYTKLGKDVVGEAERIAREARRRPPQEPPQEQDK